MPEKSRMELLQDSSEEIVAGNPTINFWRIPCEVMGKCFRVYEFLQEFRLKTLLRVPSGYFYRNSFCGFLHNYLRWILQQFLLGIPQEDHIGQLNGISLREPL